MSLLKIEYEEFVVERKYEIGKPSYWSISIHPHRKHLFKQRYSDTHENDGAQPGWMRELKFETAEAAVEFGWTLIPIVNDAKAAYAAHNSAYKQMINAAHERLTLTL